MHRDLGLSLFYIDPSDGESVSHFSSPTHEKKTGLAEAKPIQNLKKS